jgi:hypothetical protein
LENFNDIYTNSPLTELDVIISFDVNQFSNPEVQNTIVHMNDILHESLQEGDSGDFEVNGVQVTVNRLKNRIMENVVVNNPSLNNVGLIDLCA